MIDKVIDGDERIGDHQNGIAYGDDIWYGRDEDNYPLSPGIYYAKLRLESTEGGDTTNLTREVAITY